MKIINSKLLKNAAQKLITLLYADTSKRDFWVKEASQSAMKYKICKTKKPQPSK